MDEPPIIYRISNPQDLLAQILECIEQQDSRGLKTYILEHKLKDATIIWDIISKLGNCINQESYQKYEGFFDTCNRCMLYLVKVGNPKENLLAVLEQMDRFIDDLKYKCFLSYLKITLERIGSKLFHSLDITLETASSHFQEIPAPENTVLEGDEIQLFHNDQIVLRLIDNLEAYLEFLEPFVKRVNLFKENVSKTEQNEAMVMKKHLLKILNHPLYHLILTDEGEKLKSASRECAEKTMLFLSTVETNFHRLVQNTSQNESLWKKVDSKDDKQDDEEDAEFKETQDNRVNESREQGLADATNSPDFIENWDFKLEVTTESLSCLVYLIHVESLGIDKFPWIYTHDYILEFHLDVILFLEKKREYVVCYKGLALFKTLLSRIPIEALSGSRLDNPKFIECLNEVIHVMIQCPVRDLRVLATDIFPLFISKFEPDGRIQVYENILSSCSHSGVKGYLITLLKNDIAKEIDLTKKVENNLGKNNIYLSGNRLQHLLKSCLCLPDKETTDMLENSDQIISGLNFLRYLVLADGPSSNITGLWSFMKIIEREFIDPLRTGLNMSKAHYELELQNTIEGKESIGGPEVNVNVAGGYGLPSLDKQERVQLIGKALNTHSVMLSLLGRLGELIDQQKNLN